MVGAALVVALGAWRGQSRREEEQGGKGLSYSQQGESESLRLCEGRSVPRRRQDKAGGSIAKEQVGAAMLEHECAQARTIAKRSALTGAAR